MTLANRLFLLNAAAEPFSTDILFPFAFDDVYGRKAGQGFLPPLLHIWRHRRAFVIGTGDRRLPHVKEALGWLACQGYETATRNSGGAAVPLDPGVVNLSLILPNQSASLANIREPFCAMAELIRESLGKLSHRVKAGEIGGAYCPGEFDLSIGGRKFCGIAQRRLTKAVVVQAFVNVEGSGHDRATTVRRFYEMAAAGSQSKPSVSYPDVQPASMASLAEWDPAIDVETFVHRLQEQFARRGDLIMHQEYTLVSLEEVQTRLEELRLRHPVCAR